MIDKLWKSSFFHIKMIDHFGVHVLYKDSPFYLQGNPIETQYIFLKSQVILEFIMTYLNFCPFRWVLPKLL